MRALLAALISAAVLFAATARAESMIARDGTNTVRVTRALCTDPAILAHVPPEFRPRFHRGDAVLDGKPYALCWASLGDGWAVLVYADGDTGRVPVAAFAPERKL